MSATETVALGRSKRSTAGNRMRELLEKAHQEDDEIFAEAEDDEEFEAPRESRSKSTRGKKHIAVPPLRTPAEMSLFPIEDVRDVFLEDFADTDDEVELDEDDEEREIRREERRKAKGKSKAIYNPLAPSRPKQTRFAPVPEASSSTSTPSSPIPLDPSLDPSTMAPTTLILALRKQRREAKRLHRSEARRSNLRASTLRTEAETTERERQEQDHPNRKGRRAQHETGEVRVVRRMTQDELIAAALEEEERNKEDLRAWVRREEERRELRRVGRKRVRGPRWTWISRTVGKMVEVVGEGEGGREGGEVIEVTVPPVSQPGESEKAADEAPERDSAMDTVMAPASTAYQRVATLGTAIAPIPRSLDSPAMQAQGIHDPVQTDTHLPSPSLVGTTSPLGSVGSTIPSNHQPLADQHVASLSTRPATNGPVPSAPAQPVPLPTSTTDPTSNQYTRNYLILSQIDGGLPAELEIVLGNHVKWDEVQFIPGRNRPINRRPVICPFTGLPAKYRHPSTMIPYATLEGYRQIEALIANRYVWNEAGARWMGGEEDVYAEGVEEVEGWLKAVNGGWLGGSRVGIVTDDQEGEVVVGDEIQVEERSGKRRKSSLLVIGEEQGLGVPGKGFIKGKNRSKGKSQG